MAKKRSLESTEEQKNSNNNNSNNSNKKMKGINKANKKKALLAKKLKQPPVIEDDTLFERYINPKYQPSKSDLTELRNHFTSSEPFSHIHLKDFFSDEQFLQDLFSEMESEKYVEKSNDLYSFLQTKRDLRSALVEEQVLQNKKTDDELSHISKLCKVLYSKGFRSMIQSISGLDVELNQTIDLSGACYRDTAHLLCHDDEYEGRRIAFIIYFVDKEWKKEDGGCLDLFNVDGDAQPDQVVKSLVPQWNSFVFFTVTPYSYHQVAEVLQDDRFRVSISGWFYGPPIERPPTYVEPELTYEPMEEEKKSGENNDNENNDDDINKNQLLNEWINSTYLNPETQEQIREAFEEQCSVELQQFLKPEKFQALLKAINEHAKWKMIGPANRRHYEQMMMEDEGDDAVVDPIITQCHQLFKSGAIQQFLSHVINVDVTSVHTRGRKFSSGCYTLVQSLSTEETRLDAIYTLTGKDWDFDFGGQVVYMDEEEELLSVLPQANALSLVLRDKGTMQFVKYVNHNAPEPRIDLTYTYTVQFSSDDEEDDDEDYDDEEEGEGEGEGDEEEAEENDE